MDVVSNVLNFWYEEDEPNLSTDGDFRLAWFKKNDAFDNAIREQFAADALDAANGELNELRETAAGALTLCILLDQFPRNIYRGSPQAFASDAIALTTAKDAIA